MKHPQLFVLKKEVEGLLLQLVNPSTYIHFDHLEPRIIFIQPDDFIILQQLVFKLPHSRPFHLLLDQSEL